MVCCLKGYAISRGVVIKCHVAEACLGGANSSCGDGYSGRRCGQCSIGYYKMSSHCRQCSSHASTVILLVVLVLAGLILMAFFEWQAMRDPRVGSPLVLVMRLLETLGIFALSVARWPGSIPVLLSITSLVNLNTEVFQIECLLGHPHPTRAALMYVCGIPVALLVLFLFYPLLKCRNGRQDWAGDGSLLESMCEPLRPEKLAGASGSHLPFTPIEALRAATLSEYTKIALTV
jgi:hypothetical protein